MKNTKQLNENSYAGLIKDLRQYLNLSLAAFGEPLGYSATHISRFEKNITEPSCTVIENICKIYEVESGYFKGKVELKDAVAVKAVSKEEKKRLIGSRLKSIRCEKKMNTKELSQRSGVSESFICSIERGEYITTGKTAEKLARALDVGIDWLLTGDESKKEYPVDGKMTEWLWKHPEVREEIRKRMETDAG